MRKLSLGEFTCLEIQAICCGNKDGWDWTPALLVLSPTPFLSLGIGPVCAIRQVVLSLDPNELQAEAIALVAWS